MLALFPGFGVGSQKFEVTLRLVCRLFPNIGKPDSNCTFSEGGKFFWHWVWTNYYMYIMIFKKKIQESLGYLPQQAKFEWHCTIVVLLVEMPILWRQKKGLRDKEMIFSLLVVRDSGLGLRLELTVVVKKVFDLLRNAGFCKIYSGGHRVLDVSPATIYSPGHICVGWPQVAAAAGRHVTYCHTSSRVWLGWWGRIFGVLDWTTQLSSTQPIWRPSCPRFELRVAAILTI